MQDLQGVRVAVALGPTREPIDPVRVITNRSSGLMGLAIARAAIRRGADVRLVSSVGAGDLGVPTVPFETVAELRTSVLDACRWADILLMPVAVSDFRPIKASEHKIKKSGARLVLELEPVEDFSHEYPPHVFTVVFAAETEDVLANARAKLDRKRVQMVCANDVGEPGSGFGTMTNRVTIVTADGATVALPLMSKDDVAHAIFDQIVTRLPRWHALHPPRR